jgi:methylated-DNA-[protein]-cysteine S-methyltransferase
MNARDLKRLAADAEMRARAASVGFADAAAGAGLLDVAVTTTPSPLGDLLIAVTPRGLVRLAYPGEGHDAVLRELARQVSPRVLESSAATDEVRRELDEYFEGRRHAFDLPIDLALSRGFARRTLRATARIPFGSLVSYAELARRVGSPRAARAVGNALGSNPIPIVVPCHRVVRTGGSLGGYTGGIERKVTLLRIEDALPEGLRDEG